MKETRSSLNEKTHKRFRVAAWMYSLLIVFAVLVFAYTVWFSFVLVSDDGMQPTTGDGDVIMCDKLSIYFWGIHRGDVFVFTDSSGNAALGRAVALTDETVQISEGKTYIDRMLLDESKYTVGISADMDAISVPRGYIFVMPDDRDSLIPSDRTMLIPITSIVGKAALRVSPLNRLGVFA